MSEGSRVGSVIASKYRLDDELGRGGMGAVYRAFHLRVHKVFALKMLLGDVAKHHKSMASRFLLEAQAAGRIGHPGILDVYDVGEDADGTPFIVMELLRGEALSSLIRRERIDVDAACWIAIHVLDVLEAAHKAGIIHRDVKPQNVFITERSEGESGPASGMPERGVKLLDFGIAKFSGIGEGGSVLTRSGEIIGSPLYMAPEQAKGEPDLDERADVWSVGAMLFEMLTGTCAHAATSPVAVLAKILTEPAPAASAKNASVPPELDEIVGKALKIDRAERWPNAKTMREALTELRTSLGHSGPPSLPKAPKVSVPPPSSTGRTPGAITSTILQPSPPPSHPPRAIASETPPPPNAQDTTAPSATKPRSPIVLVATVAVAAGALIIVGTQLQRSPSPSSPPPSVRETPAVAAVSVPLPVAVSAEPVVAVSSLPAAPAVSTSATTPLTLVATVDAGKVPPAAVSPAFMGPKCVAGETMSNGHCCARGLEWQNGRCERPIATTF